jgi:hypothetical protein
MLLLAQTTHPVLPEIPVSWTEFLTAFAAVLSGFTFLLGLLWKIWQRLGTNTRNIQSLAGATLSNTKAIQQSPGPAVPLEVEETARAIRNDPNTAAPPPCRTDPIPTGDENDPSKPPPTSPPSDPRAGLRGAIT